MTTFANVPLLPLRLGASIAVFEAGAVLLVKRGRPPFQGLWSLPGGRLRAGESPRAAALRELKEETGIEADILGLLDVIDIEAEDSAGGEPSYRLSVFYGRPCGGDLAARGDAAKARFVALGEIGTLDLTPRAADLIRLARCRLGAAPA